MVLEQSWRWTRLVCFYRQSVRLSCTVPGAGLWVFVLQNLTWVLCTRHTVQVPEEAQADGGAGFEALGLADPAGSGLPARAQPPHRPPRPQVSTPPPPRTHLMQALLS